MSNFAFLAVEFPAVHEAAMEAERQAAVSPTASALFAGKAVEVAVKRAFRAQIVIARRRSSEGRRRLLAMTEARRLSSLGSTLARAGCIMVT